MFLVSVCVQLKNYAHVLEMLLRLRQVCCHPRLAAPKPPSYGASIDDVCHPIPPVGERHDVLHLLTITTFDVQEKAEHLLALLQGGEGEECCICLSAMSDPVITTCAHIYCKPCITR
jgi:SWI/SNF-related matrix-associated actin-dependent regulator of chromatin subfamily A3